MASNRSITIRDIAAEANVSIATVSNVVNNKGRVSPETRRLIESIIEKYNYTPNLSARSLKNKSSRLISVIIPYLQKGEFEDNPYFWQILSAIEPGARDENFHVMLTGISKDENLSFIHERHLDGIIVIGINENTDLFKKLRSMDIPCVYMDSYIKEKGVYQVFSNDRLGGYLATKYLISLGHRKVILVSGIKGKIDEKSGVDYRRWCGYCQALEEAGIPCDPGLIVEEGQTMVGGYYAAQKVFHLIDDNTAIFVLSDIGAMGLIRGLNELGVSVPGDVSVMGYDDIFYASYMIPSLTTIAQNIFVKGKNAVDLLLAQIEGRNLKEREITLPVELKIRESTARRS
jgi:LacI family transcriptional regulator